MRFILLSTERPRRVAKRLRTLASNSGLILTQTRALGITASLYGYRDWQDLSASSGRETASPDDAECAPDVVLRRHAFQVAALVANGFKPEIASAIIDTLHPTRSAVVRSKREIATLLSDLLERHEGDTVHLRRGRTEVRVRSQGMMRPCEPFDLNVVDEIFSTFMPVDEAINQRVEPAQAHAYVGQLLFMSFGDVPGLLLVSRRCGPGEVTEKMRKLSGSA